MLELLEKVGRQNTGGALAIVLKKDKTPSFSGQHLKHILGRFRSVPTPVFFLPEPAGLPRSAQGTQLPAGKAFAHSSNCWAIMTVLLSL